MRLNLTPVSAAMCIALASGASAQTATINVSAASAVGDRGAPGNTVLGGVFSETFVARSLTWSGQLSSGGNPFFFEEDVFVSVQGPNGLGYTGAAAGEQGIFLGTTPFSGWFSGFTPASVTGGWSFEAYTPNTFPNSTDWSIGNAEFAFDAALFPNATAVGVGTQRTDALTEGEIVWYQIDHLGGALDISTAGSEIFELDGAIQVDDTLIALFDDMGSLVASNDDAAPGVSTSELSFASLEAGEYRLAVTGSTLGTRVGQSFISTSHDGEGTISLTVVPAPAAVCVGAIGLVAGSARRRR